LAGGPALQLRQRLAGAEARLKGAGLEQIDQGGDRRLIATGERRRGPLANDRRPTVEALEESLVGQPVVGAVAVLWLRRMYDCSSLAGCFFAAIGLLSALRYPVTVMLLSASTSTTAHALFSSPAPSTIAFNVW